MSAPRQHPVHPGGHVGGFPLTPWLLLGALAAAVALSWLAWAAHRRTRRRPASHR